MGVEAPQVVLNDRVILFALLDAAGVPQDKRGGTCVLLDKLDKVERAQIVTELTELLGSGPAEALEKSIIDGDKITAAPEALARLEWIRETLKTTAGIEAKVSPSLIRGFDYYTGPVFEFRSPKLSGSLGGGGRYDKLTEKFGGAPVPACGASIGFERLMLLLEEDPAAAKAGGPDFCMTVFSEELRAQSLKLAARLRQAGKTVDVYPGKAKLGTQFKYADAKRAARVLVLGPDEAAAGVVNVKELATGKEEKVALETLL